MPTLKASRPSPVFVLAVLALVAALAGTAIAGPDGISGKVTKSKVKTIAKKQINKAAPDLSVANADRLGGDPAGAYLKTSGVRFVKINADGTVDESQSKGVTQANVTKADPAAVSTYCIGGLDPAPRSVQVTPDFRADYEAVVYGLIDPPVLTSGCGGQQVAISTFTGNDSSNVDDKTEMPVYVALFH